LIHVKNLCSKHSPYCNQFISFVQLRQTVCNPMDYSTPGFLVHHQLPELAETQVLRIPDAIQPSNLISSPSPWPSFLPSIRIFSNETVHCIRLTKYCCCSFSVSPSSEQSGLIPHVHGVVAAWAQEALEELFHVQGQEWWQ